MRFNTYNDTVAPNSNTSTDFLRFDHTVVANSGVSLDFNTCEFQGPMWVRVWLLTFSSSDRKDG